MALLVDLDLRKIAAHYVREKNPIPGDCLKSELVTIVGQIDAFLETNMPTLLAKIDGKLAGLTSRQKVLLISYVLLRKVNQLQTSED